MLRVVVLIRLTRFGRQRLLGRNLITLFFTVNTRTKKSSARAARPSPRRARLWRRRVAPAAAAVRDAFQTDAENKRFSSMRSGRRRNGRVALVVDAGANGALRAAFAEAKKNRRKRSAFAPHKPICAELREPERRVSRRLHTCRSEHRGREQRCASCSIPGRASGATNHDVHRPHPGFHHPDHDRRDPGKENARTGRASPDEGWRPTLSRPRPRSARRSRRGRAARPAGRRRWTRARTASLRRRRPR